MSGVIPQELTELVSLIPRRLVDTELDPASLSRGLAGFFKSVETGALVAGETWNEVVPYRVKRKCLALAASRTVTSVLVAGNAVSPPITAPDAGREAFRSDGELIPSWLDFQAVLTMCRLVVPDFPEGIVQDVTAWVVKKYLDQLPSEMYTAAPATLDSDALEAARQGFANGWSRVFTNVVINYPLIEICDKVVLGFVDTIPRGGMADATDGGFALSLEQAILKECSDAVMDSTTSPPCEGDVKAMVHTVSQALAIELGPLLFSTSTEGLEPSRLKSMVFDCLVSQFCLGEGQST